MFRVLVLGSVAALLGASNPAWVAVSSEPHHRPIFENYRIRALDVVIPPGHVTLYHRHDHGLAGVTIADSSTLTEVLGESATDDPADGDGEVWFEDYSIKPVTHRVTNIGNRDLHIVAIELLPADGPGRRSGTFGSMPGYTTNLQKEWVRISRTVLGPGDYSGEHTHGTGYIVISLSKGRLASLSSSAHKQIDAVPGFISWGDAHTTHSLRNVGAQKIEIVEMEFE